MNTRELLRLSYNQWTVKNFRNKLKELFNVDTEEEYKRWLLKIFAELLLRYPNCTETDQDLIRQSLRAALEYNVFNVTLAEKVTEYLNNGKLGKLGNFFGTTCHNTEFLMQLLDTI